MYILNMSFICILEKTMLQNFLDAGLMQCFLKKDILMTNFM